MDVAEIMAALHKQREEPSPHVCEVWTDDVGMGDTLYFTDSALSVAAKVAEEYIAENKPRYVKIVVFRNGEEVFTLTHSWLVGGWTVEHLPNLISQTEISS